LGSRRLARRCESRGGKEMIECCATLSGGLTALEIKC